MKNSRGHGRIETRRIWSTDLIDAGEFIKFPSARQVFRIETRVTDLSGKSLRKSDVEVSFGVTSLTRDQARRGRLLDLHRSHWSIENKVHWVRDVTFDEDRSQVRHGAAAHIMASLRNVAMNVLRIAGVTNVPMANRHVARHPEVAARLVGVNVAA